MLLWNKTSWSLWHWVPARISGQVSFSLVWCFGACISQKDRKDSDGTVLCCFYLWYTYINILLGKCLEIWSFQNIFVLIRKSDWSFSFKNGFCPIYLYQHTYGKCLECGHSKRVRMRNGTGFIWIQQKSTRVFILKRDGRELFVHKQYLNYLPKWWLRFSFWREDFDLKLLVDRYNNRIISPQTRLEGLRCNFSQGWKKPIMS